MDIYGLLINAACTVIGAVLGAGITLKVTSNKQKQKAGKGSTQNQSGRDTIINGG